MGTKNLCKVVLAVWIVFAGCDTIRKTDSTNSKPFIAYTDSHIQYEGRIGLKNDAAELYWPGTTLRLNFNGTGIKALIKDEKGQNFYNIIIDGKITQRLKMDTTRKFYTLAENLSPGTHTLELFKITQYHKEYGRGFTKFYGFQLDNGKILSPPKLKKNKIEFYGNSITCGHAIEDTTGGDSGASKFENNYLSYAALTARHFDAQYSCIAKSGVGLMVSWVKPIMPEIYNLTNPADSSTTWDFSKYRPDVVVVNLTQNDAAIVTRPDHIEFKRRFGSTAPTEEVIISTYGNFIKSIRKEYPQAKIICVLGSMGATAVGSKWPGYISSAVANLKDDKIYTHFFPYKNTAGHPRVTEQKVMAESLINFMEAHQFFKN